MSFRIIFSYVVLVLTVLVILASGLLIALQWGVFCGFSVYGKEIEADEETLPTIFVVLGSVVFGLLLPQLIRLMWRSWRTIAQHRRFQDTVRKAADKAVTATPAAPEASLIREENA